MQKKKLLILYSFLAPYRIDTYTALADEFETSVLLTGSEKDRATLAYDLEAVNRRARFNYFYHSKGFMLFDRHLISSIYYKTIKKFKPDIVLASELGINTIIMIMMRPFYRYKLYTTVDDSPNMAKEYGMFRRILRNFVIRHTDGCIVVNPQVIDYLKQNTPSNKSNHYYLPIIQNEKMLKNIFCDVLPLSKNIFEQYDFRGKKIILFVGRLINIKDPQLLLKVFSNIYKNNQDLRLIFIGSGILEKELKDFRDKNNLNDVVVFTGQLTGNELYAWFNIGQILVLPSQREPFGAVVNEALIAGCRTVVSDSIGATCLIDEENGRIFETNNFESLKKTLSEIIEKTPPLNDICLKECLMKESFSTTILKFVNFLNL